MEPLEVVVDGGIDDAVALAVLLGAGVPIRQVVATEGSVALPITARTTARFLASIGAGGVPVRLGARRGLGGPYPTARDPFHGADGFGGFGGDLAGAALPVSALARLEGPVFVSSAMTVVAQALHRDDPVTSVLWMGGAVAVGGNMTAAAEFNAWMDPTAADEVLTSACPVSMVPLDVTMSCRWSRDDLAALAALGPAGELLSRAAGALCERDGIFVPHDAVTAIALIEPARFSWRERHVRCEREGLVAHGATVVDRRRHAPPPNATVAEACDPREIRAAIFAAIAELAG